jgi:hypothetical protein
MNSDAAAASPTPLFGATLPAALGFASGRITSRAPAGALRRHVRANHGQGPCNSTSRFDFRSHPNIHIAKRRNQMSTAKQTSNKTTVRRFQDATTTGDPELISKTIDAAQVADRLAGLATGPPAGRVPDLGGPQVRTATSLLRGYLHAAGRRRPVLPVRLPGATFAGYRHGGHLAHDRAVGRRTWEEFLADQLGHPRPAGVDGTTAEGRA